MYKIERRDRTHDGGYQGFLLPYKLVPGLLCSAALIFPQLRGIPFFLFHDKKLLQAHLDLVLVQQQDQIMTIFSS